METIKQDLKQGIIFTFENTNCYHEMEVEHFRSHSGNMYYKCVFNGQWYLYKTFEAFEKKCNYFIEKYALVIS